MAAFTASTTRCAWSRRPIPTRRIVRTIHRRGSIPGRPIVTSRCIDSPRVDGAVERGRSHGGRRRLDPFRAPLPLERARTYGRGQTWNEGLLILLTRYQERPPCNASNIRRFATRSTWQIQLRFVPGPGGSEYRLAR